MRQLKPVTPGELLLEEFLKPMEISQYRLAREIVVPAFGLSNGYWLRAQAPDDTEGAERTLGSTLAKIKSLAGPKTLTVASQAPFPRSS